MKEYQYCIGGLDCPNCASQLETDLKKIKEVEDVHINFFTQKLYFKCLETDHAEALKKIRKIIKKNEPDVSLEV